MNASIPTSIEGVSYRKVYYVRGTPPKHWSRRFYISDPPTSGLSHAFVIESQEQNQRKGRGRSRITLLCPTTLTSFQVPPDAGELMETEPLSPERVQELGDRLTRNWLSFCEMGFQRDYDVAALILSRLGLPVPTAVPVGAEEGEDTSRRAETRQRGGKPAATHLLRAVDRSSRRGVIAEFFLEGPRSMREAMAKLDMSRSGVLTHLHGLWSVHGIGYTLVGDTAALIPPGGCDVFSVAVNSAGWPPVTTELTHKAAAEALAPLPKKGKRLAVLRAFLELEGGRDLSEVALAANCTLASVRSHLHDLQHKHGVGYQYSDGKRMASVILPPGLEVPEPEE